MAGLAARLKTRAASGQFEYLSPIHSGGQLTPLFCMHGAIRRLMPYLGTDRPVYLLYRQFDSDTFAELTVESLAEAYLEEIRRVQPHGPYHLCGFSFGGQVAYEIARTLRGEGERVGLLGLLDPPPVGDTSYSQVMMTRKLAQIRSVEGLAARLAFILREVPAGLGRVMRRRWVHAQARIRERRGVPMETALLQERDRRNYMRASQKYCYAPYPGRALLVMPERVQEILDATSSAFGNLIERDLDVHVIRGARAHEDMMREPHCEILAQILIAAMAAAETPFSDVERAADTRPTTADPWPA